MDPKKPICVPKRAPSKTLTILIRTDVVVECNGVVYVAPYGPINKSGSSFALFLGLFVSLSFGLEMPFAFHFLPKFRHATHSIDCICFAWRRIVL